MATDKLKKRLGLFDLYVKNAAIHELAFGERFLCPVCGKLFDRSSCESDGKNSELTLAHIYSQAVGSEAVTLACTKCNGSMNFHDASIEYEHRRNQAFDPSKLDKKLKTKVVIGDKDDNKSVKIDLAFDGSALQATFPTNPYIVSEIERQFAKHGGEPPLKLLCNPYPSESVQLSMLYSSHLLLFKEFGYEYLSSSLDNWVRHAIVDGENEIQRMVAEDRKHCEIRTPVIGFSSIDNFGPELMYRIATVVKPLEKRCLVAIFPSEVPQYTARAVVLPGDTDEASLQAFEAMKKEPSIGTFTFATDLAPEKRLTDKTFKHLMRHNWRSVSMLRTN